MIIFYIAIVVLSIIGINISKDGYHKNYLSKESTNAIKGIFLLFIVVSHALPYVTRCGYEFNGLGDNLLRTINIAMGQLVVVMFLFYSGYGIGESYKKKGDTYVNRMPTHRVLNTLLNFDVAVLIFAVVCLFLSIPFTTKQFFLSLIAWEALGNSNWYIFCILACYTISYVVLKVSPPNSKYTSIILTFISLIVVSLVLSLFKQSWWYNTMWAYGAGFAYSCLKPQIEKRLKSHYFMALCLVTFLFIALFLLKYEYRGIRYNLLSISFAVLLVIISMKITVNNPILCWVGKNLFPMYIYQRLPMLYMSHQNNTFCGNYPILFITISLVATIFISYFYKYWQISLK